MLLQSLLVGATLAISVTGKSLPKRDPCKNLQSDPRNDYFLLSDQDACYKCMDQEESCQDDAGKDPGSAFRCVAIAQLCYQGILAYPSDSNQRAWSGRNICDEANTICDATKHADPNACSIQEKNCEKCLFDKSECDTLVLWQSEKNSNRSCVNEFQTCYKDAITRNGTYYTSLSGDSPPKTGVSDESVSLERRTVYDCNAMRHVLFNHAGASPDIHKLDTARASCNDCKHKQNQCLAAAKLQSQRIGCVVSAQLCFFRAYTSGPSDVFDFPYMCNFFEADCLASRLSIGSVCFEQGQRCKACQGTSQDQMSSCIGAAMSLNGMYPPWQPTLAQRDDHGDLSESLEVEAISAGTSTSLQLRQPWDDDQDPLGCNGRYDLCTIKYDEVSCKRFHSRCGACTADYNYCLETLDGNNNSTGRIQCTIEAQLCYSSAVIHTRPSPGPVNVTSLCKDTFAFCELSGNISSTICTTQHDVCQQCTIRKDECLRKPGNTTYCSDGWATCFKQAMTLNGSYPPLELSSSIDHVLAKQRFKQLLARAETIRSASGYDCVGEKRHCDATVPANPAVDCNENFKACSVCKAQGDNNSPEAFAACLGQTSSPSHPPSLTKHGRSFSKVLDARTLAGADSDCEHTLQLCNLMLHDSGSCEKVHANCLLCAREDHPEKMLECFLNSFALGIVSLEPHGLVSHACNCTSVSHCTSSVPNSCPEGCGGKFHDDQRSGSDEASLIIRQYDGDEIKAVSYTHLTLPTKRIV